MSIDRLTELTIIHGSDKFGYHDYSPNYYHLFKHLKNKPIKLLEIGVGGYADADRGGESLRVWRDFFPKAHIVGIDIQTKELDLGPRVTILKGSQVDAKFLDQVVAEHGPFDIIIDDGSHRNEQIVASFEMLFPTLNADGIYVAEDVQTAFFPRFGGSLEMEHPNCVGFFSDLGSDFSNGQVEENAFAEVVGVERFHNMIALHKAPKGKADWSKRAKSGAEKIVVANPDFVTENLTEQLSALSDGEALLIEDAVLDGDVEMTSEFKEIFIDIDHREKAIWFEDASNHEAAETVYSLARGSDFTLLRKGDNSYPSNFDFDAGHPRAVETLAAMRAVLENSTEETGFLLYFDLNARAGHADAVEWALDRLLLIKASTRKFLNYAIMHYRKAGDLAAAQRMLLIAREAYPADTDFMTQQAALAHREKDYETALDLASRAVDSEPRRPQHHALLAKTKLLLGDFSGAIKAANAALDIRNDMAAAYRTRARAEMSLADGQAAKKTLLLGLVHHPHLALMHRELSEAYVMTGELSLAMLHIDKALEALPEHREFKAFKQNIKAQLMEDAAGKPQGDKPTLTLIKSA